MRPAPCTLNWIMAGLLPLLWPFQGQSAEGVQCKVRDFACMDQEFERACVGPAPTVESCLAWSKAVEVLAPRDPIATLMLGKSYIALSNLGAVSPQPEGYRAMGVNTFKKLIAQDSANFQAVFELALASQDSLERTRLLKQAVAINPDIYALQLLASELIQTGNKADALEAGKFMEQAYAHQSGPNKWHLANRALQILESNGNEAEARQFREHVRKEFGGDSKLERLNGNPSTKVVADTLGTVCYPAAIGAAGGAYCLSALSTVYSKLERTTDRATAQELANQLSVAMLTAAQEGDEIATVKPNWKEQFTTWINGLIDRRLASIDTYIAMAQVAADNTTRIDALKKVAELAPNSAGAAIRLGEEYMRLGRYDEAIKEFEKAKANPPPSQDGGREFNGIVDQHLKQAHALKSRSSNSHHDVQH